MLRTCQHCGKGFKAKPSEVRRGFGRYCSRSCAGHYKTKPPQKGELNH